MPFEFPAWVDALPEDERPQAKLRFLLKLAALYASHDGSLSKLSVMCGLARATLAAYTTDRDCLTAELALKVEKSCADQVVKRQHLRPDLFEGA